jgi:hypothetical protein
MSFEDYNLRINQSRVANYNIKVNQFEGRINTTAPVTLRNEKITGPGPVSQLADLIDVVEVLKADGSSLVYDSENARYEVKSQNLDGGSF